MWYDRPVSQDFMLFCSTKKNLWVLREEKWYTFLQPTLTKQVILLGPSGNAYVRHWSFPQGTWELTTDITNGPSFTMVLFTKIWLMMVRPTIYQLYNDIYSFK